MNTDGYSNLISENKIDRAAQRAIMLAKKTCITPDKIGCCVTKALHEQFCPCLFTTCPTCAHGEETDGSVSDIEQALISEIFLRINKAHYRPVT